MSGTILAIDVGGSKIAAALVTKAGTVRHRRRVATPQGGIEPLLDALIELVDELLTRSDGDVRGLGLAVPGIVDVSTGTAVVAANLPWRNTPLADILTRRTGLRTVVGNDADGATLAEAWFGTARSYRTYVCLTIGTGIGGGVMIDRRLLRGARGSAFEIGHMIIDPAGPPCRCGSRGCLETLASGPAIARRMAAHGGGDMSAEQVIGAARAGDALAQRVLAETAEPLAVAIVNLRRLFNPESIIVGGGAAAADDLLIGPLLRHATTLSPARPLPAGIVSISPLHREASFLSAASLVLEADMPHSDTTRSLDIDSAPLAVLRNDTGRRAP